MAILTLITLISWIFIWGAFSRIYDLEQELFDLKYPEMHNDIMAEYIGQLQATDKPKRKD